MKRLKGSPAPEELISGRLDSREGRRENAIVITTSGNPRKLAAHLEALAGQDSKDFDIIIVYGEKDGFFSGPAPAGILHVREKGRLGSAGAFYLGERVALDEGYGMIILADDDALPSSPSLVGSLVAGVRGGKKAVLPLFRSAGNISRTRIPHYYGAFSREVFAKAGLTYLPLFFGGEDVELMRRIEAAGFRIEYVDDAVSHPAIMPFLIDASAKRYYYTRGEFEALVLSGSVLRPALFAAFHMMAASALFALGRADIAGRIAGGLLDGASMRFFQKDLSPKADTLREENGNWDIVVDNAGGPRAGAPNMLLHKGAGLGRFAKLGLTLCGILMKMPGYFGKKVLVRGGNNALNLAAILGARSAYLEYEGRRFRIFAERGAPGILAGLLLLGLMAPLSLMAALPLSIAGHLRRMMAGADSAGYGAQGKHF